MFPHNKDSKPIYDVAFSEVRVLKKLAPSCDNVTTCSPRGQINLLVIAHLNISDNSFNINSEFTALPDFHIYASISAPSLKSYKGFKTYKACLF